MEDEGPDTWTCKQFLNEHQMEHGQNLPLNLPRNLLCDTVDNPAMGWASEVQDRQPQNIVKYLPPCDSTQATEIGTRVLLGHLPPKSVGPSLI